MEFTEYVFPVARIGEYICGMSLGYISYSINTKIENNRKSKIVFSIMEIIIFVIWVCVMYIPMEEWHFRIVHWIVPNCMLLMVFTIGRGVLSIIFKSRFLKYLGDISFECYLLHAIIIRQYQLNSNLDSISKLGNAFSIAFCIFLTSSKF